MGILNCVGAGKFTKSTAANAISKLKNPKEKRQGTEDDASDHTCDKGVPSGPHNRLQLDWRLSCYDAPSVCRSMAHQKEEKKDFVKNL